MNTVCLDAVVVPELGVVKVSGLSTPTYFGSNPVVSQRICVAIVPIPCPIQAAEVLIIALPSLITILTLPVSGIPTPTPAFLNAQDIPTCSLLSNTSLTASNVFHLQLNGLVLIHIGSEMWIFCIFI